MEDKIKKLVAVFLFCLLLFSVGCDDGDQTDVAGDTGLGTSPFYTGGDFPASSANAINDEINDNAADIATNVANIATNTSDVATLQTAVGSEAGLESSTGAQLATETEAQGYVTTHAGESNPHSDELHVKCWTFENLAATDDNYEISFWSFPVTILKVGVSYEGTGTTPAQISLEDGDGNAMTHTTPTAVTGATAVTFQSVTGGALTSGERLAFDVDNSVDPETDEYTICVEFKKE